MFKRTLIFLMFFFFMISSTSLVHAREVDPGTGGHTGGGTGGSTGSIPSARVVACTGDDGLISKKTQEQLEKSKEDATLTDKFIIGQAQNLVNMGPINSISNLVYGNPYCVWSKGQLLSSDGIFTVAEREKIIDPVFRLIGVIYATVITLAIMISALRLGFKAYSPQSKADFWQDVTYWVLSALFLGSFTLITDILFGLNSAIVNSLYSMTGGRADNISIIAGFKEDVVIGYVFTLIAEWILSLILNVIYIARKITILLLMIMGAVAAISLLFSKSRYFFGVWLKELIGNVFIQSIHAIILFAFAMMAETGASVVMKLGMMIMFIPLTGMISKWLNLGDSSTKLGQTLTMTGLAGIGGAYMLAKQSSSVLRGGGQSGDAGLSSSGSNSLTTSGGGSDTGPTSISANASGVNSSGFQSTKDLIGKVGGVVGAVGGAVAGPAGVAVGMKLGSAAARGAVQLGKNAHGLYTGTRETVKDIRGFGNENGGLKSNWSNLEQRRKMMGNIGETLGTAFSTGGTKAGTIGRNLGQMTSGVSQSRIMETPKHEGGLGGPINAEELQSKYGGKDAVWVQNKDHSYFALKNEDGTAGQRITTYGAGDTTLASGETRMRDYTIGRPAFDGGEKGYEEVTKPKPGKPGSSYNLQARSDVYTMKDGEKIKDTRMNESRINPDSYIGHTALKGGERTKTDRVADLVHNTAEGTREGAKLAGIGIRRTADDVVSGARGIGTTIGTGIKMYSNDVKEGASNLKENWNQQDAWVKNAEEQREKYERRRDFL